MPHPTAGKTYTVTQSDPLTQVRIYYTAFKVLADYAYEAGVSPSFVMRDFLADRLQCTIKSNTPRQPPKGLRKNVTSGYWLVALRLPREVDDTLAALAAANHRTKVDVIIALCAPRIGLKPSDFKMPKSDMKHRGRPFKYIKCAICHSRIRPDGSALSDNQQHSLAETD